MKIIPIFILTVAILGLACTSSSDQRDFESEAYRDPSGITRTDNRGEIIGTPDPDDWRVSPLYQGLIDIKPPYQNPAQLGTAINFEVQVLGIQGVAGLEILVRLNNNRLSSIYTSTDNPLEPGVITFRIDPIALSQDGSDKLALGLHRIYFFDFDGRLISYGDIEVE